jgi:hypothetical protein
MKAPAMLHVKQMYVPVIICSLVAGILAFLLTDYRAFTLVLEAKTARNGNVQVDVTGAAPQGNLTKLHFPVRTDLEGYVVELPAMPFDALRIAPLEPSGQFAISKITLSNDAVSYRWNSDVECSQKRLLGRQIIRSKCDPDHPRLKYGADGSVSISAIPDTGAHRAISERVVMAIVPASVLFLAGMGLIAFYRREVSLSHMQIFCGIAVWIIVLSVYLYQFLGIYIYSVDVPYSDDWIYFEPGNLKLDFPYDWIFKQELEHRIVLTKLLGWINLRLLDLDYCAQKLFNYLLFGSLLLSLVYLKNKLLGKGAFICFPLFLVFLLSPIAWENHRWALQSDYHFSLMFACLALCYVSPRELSMKSIGLFCLFSCLAMYSLAPGAVLATVYWLCSVVYLIARIAREKDSPSLRWLLVIQILAMGLIVCSWTYGYKNPADVWPHAYLFPWEPGYWGNYLNMISFSFGFQDDQVLPGVVCLGMVLVPLGVLLVNNETRWQSITWSLVSANVGILAVFAVVAMARADVNYYGAKTSRYAEVGFLMIPFMAIAWWHILQTRKSRGVVLTLLWLFFFFGYFDNWSSQAYRETKQYDLQTLECAENYYNGTGDGLCRGETFPNAQVLDRARELGVNFTKQLVRQSSR